MVLIFSFMYVPIAVMAVFSFNESKSRSNFTGFTFDWYINLFRNDMILSALGLSLVIALVASVIATILGTMASIGIHSMHRASRTVIMNISYLPVINPEIITGVSMMLLFVVVKNWMGGKVFGMPTLLIAHITFCVPYVIFNVSPKLRQMDVRMWEAAAGSGMYAGTGIFQGCPAGDYAGGVFQLFDLPDLFD